MPAGPDIQICLALSPHAKTKILHKKRREGLGGEIPFLPFLCTVHDRKLTPRQQWFSHHYIFNSSVRSNLLHGYF